MRIDLLLASEELMRKVEEVEILGGGNSNKDESFCGSDHCPVFIRMTREVKKGERERRGRMEGKEGSKEVEPQDGGQGGSAISVRMVERV